MRKYATRKPYQLSGGQQQRVALARSLAKRPKLLLLDEPLGALDKKLRQQTQLELVNTLEQVGVTCIMVTHDQEEAMTMADTVAVMNAGVIEQLGAPAELYENPRSTFVANFLGQSNLIEGAVLSRSGDVTSVDMQGVTVSVPTARTHTDGAKGWVGIRPEKVLIGEEGEALDAPGNTIPGGVVTDVSFVGVSTQYLVRMPWGQELQVFSQNTGRTRIFATGDRVELSWRPEYAFLLDISQDAAAGVQRGDDD
jgi:spermidine/putrescine transport system ATP-binding protein